MTDSIEHRLLVRLERESRRWKAAAITLGLVVVGLVRQIVSAPRQGRQNETPGGAGPKGVWVLGGGGCGIRYPGR